MPSSGNRGIIDLARAVSAVRNDPEVSSIIDAREREFKLLRERASDDEWFSELCFCLLTANSSARLGMRIQNVMRDGCLRLPEREIERLLSEQGHRFPRARTDYICRARKIENLVSQIDGLGDEREAREWLVENVKGLGYKEASHFLRNTGHFNVAILDRHILRLMEEHDLIPEMPKNLTRRRYLEYEKILEKLAAELAIPLGILDLHLWYMKTGEVLK